MKRSFFLFSSAALLLAAVLYPSSIGKPGGGGATQGAFASAPTCNAGAANTVYFASDAGLEGECNGTAWLWHYGNIVVTPTTSAVASIWYNQQCCGGAGEAFVANNGAASSVTLQAGVWSNSQIQGRLRTVPSTPYTYVVCMSAFGGQSNASIGLMWTNGTNKDTSLVTTMSLQAINNFGFGTGLYYTKWTNATTFSAEYTVTQGNRANEDISYPKCFALVDNGTNRKIGWSTDKTYWFNGNYAAVSRTDFLTPTHLGYFVNANSSQAPVQANVFSEEVFPTALF